MRRNLKPAAPASWLILLAGILWTAVGSMLCRLALIWLRGLAPRLFLGLAGLSLALAVPAYLVGFSQIAERNIERLLALPARACIFSFQTWKSYLLIGFMIGMGGVLRDSALPRHYLAVVYMTMGIALILSSFRYYVTLIRGRPSA